MQKSQRPLRRNSAISGDRIAIVGRIGAPYGVKGWAHCQSYTDPVENILTYPLWVQRSDEWFPLELADIRPHKSNYRIKISGCDDRDEAAELRGLLLGTDVKEFPAPEDDEFYWRDLIGLTVVNEAGEPLGEVKSLTETGHHDVLVIRGKKGEETLIPFSDRFVVEVCVAQRRVVVAWASDW